MFWNQKRLHRPFKQCSDGIGECSLINNWLMNGLTTFKVAKQEVDGEGEDVGTQPQGYQAEVWLQSAPLQSSSD